MNLIIEIKFNTYDEDGNLTPEVLTAKQRQEVTQKLQVLIDDLEYLVQGTWFFTRDQIASVQDFLTDYTNFTPGMVVIEEMMEDMATDIDDQGIDLHQFTKDFFNIK